MRTLLSSLPVLAIWLLSQTAVASGYPTTGILFGVKERDSMSYSCFPVSKDRLQCEFVQTSVDKIAKAKDWPKKLAEAKIQFKELKSKSDDCRLNKDQRNYLIALRGGAQNTLTKEYRDRLLASNQLERDAAARFLEAMSALCTSKSESAFIDFVKLGFDLETRTCRIGSNTFKQEFRWISDPAGKGAWVADPTPFGPCGVVQLSRFEEDKSSGTSGLFWNYTARKAITNPQGEFVTQCSKWDQSSYPYVWRRPPNAGLQCDFIKFGF